MRFSTVFTFLLLAAVSGTCSAHTGVHSLEGFADGLIHPFLGSDHVLAMLGVGLWAALLPAARWRLPVAFMGFMLVGGWLGAAGLSTSVSEVAIALSVIAVGLLLAGKCRPALPLALGLTGLFALFHGMAHGAEMAQGNAFIAYAAGFVGATGILLLSGVVFGRFLLGVPALYRVVGGVAGLWGAFLLFQGV